MCISKVKGPRRRAAGLTFIELIMFIVIVGVGVVGVLTAMNTVTSHSSDTLPRKQALAIAESLLEEIELQAFTWCDPDDSVNQNVSLPSSAADCTGGAGGANDESRLPLGPETGESRYSSTAPFDNVSDYNGFSMSGIKDVSNASIAGLGNYSAQVTVAQAGTTFSLPADAVLQITVHVTGPSGVDISLTGYRFRYAPNAI